MLLNVFFFLVTFLQGSLIRLITMSPPVWLHCGDCGTQGTGRWFLSSCGRIVCKDCHPQLSVNHCQACRGPCSRTVELTSRSPPDVKNLFSDPSDLVKPIIKTLDFQEKQKRNFLGGQTKRLAALDAQWLTTGV